MAGEVFIKRSDGVTTSFRNRIMADHVPAVLHALIGNEEGVINIMGAGDSISEPTAYDMPRMSSYTEDNQTVGYTITTSSEPLEDLQELDYDFVEPSIEKYTSAMYFSGNFGVESHRELDNSEISELGLICGDFDYLFARTIIPGDARIEKVPGTSLTFYWVIYYGFDEDELIRINRDKVDKGYGFLYGEHYGN